MKIAKYFLPKQIVDLAGQAGILDNTKDGAKYTSNYNADRYETQRQYSRTHGTKFSPFGLNDKQIRNTSVSNLKIIAWLKKDHAYTTEDITNILTEEIHHSDPASSLLEEYYVPVAPVIPIFGKSPTQIAQQVADSAMQITPHVTHIIHIYSDGTAKVDWTFSS